MIEHAALYTGAELYQRKESAGFGIKEVWKGTVRSGTDRADAYLKLGPQHELVADACCAWLGRRLGLNIPRPYLLRLERDDLPDSQLWAKHQTHLYAFALQDVGEHAHSLLKWLNGNDPVVRQALIDWKGCYDVMVFDEWIGNGDRNAENILYDGDFWLIDHGEAFGGGISALWGMPAPHDELPNLLFDGQAKGVQTDRDKARLLKELFEFAACCAGQRADELLHIGLTPAVIGQQVMESVVEFLAQRAPYLMTLFKRKIGLPELELDWQHFQQPVPTHVPPTTNRPRPD